MCVCVSIALEDTYNSWQNLFDIPGRCSPKKLMFIVFRRCNCQGVFLFWELVCFCFANWCVSLYGCFWNLSCCVVV